MRPHLRDGQGGAAHRYDGTRLGRGASHARRHSSPQLTSRSSSVGRPDAAQFDELVRRLDPDEDGKIAPRLGHRSGSHAHGPRHLLPHTVYLPPSAGKITVKDLHLLVSEIELRDHAKKDDDDDDDDDDAEAPPKAKAKAKRAAQ